MAEVDLTDEEKEWLEVMLRIDEATIASAYLRESDPKSQPGSASQH
jgi:hypothetical protein